MVNVISQLIGGFFTGLFAGIIGYAADISIGAIFEAFGVLNSKFVLLGILYVLVSFLLGIAEAYAAGLAFCFGIVCAGMLVNDGMTIIAGIIAIFGIVLSLLPKGGSSRGSYGGF